MAVVVPAGFQVTSQDPIDSRITVVDQNARLALNEFNVYPGLIVYQQSSQEVYVLNDTGSVNSNSGWSLLSGSAGSSGFAAEWSLGASGNNDYVFSGDGFPNPTADPTLILVRGQDYKFSNDNGAGLHPFQIQTNAPSGGSGTPYSAGVTNNGGAGGTVITWNVPFSAPDQLYYQCTSHPNMSGSIRLLNTGSGGGGGGGIFEQTGSFYATTNDLQVTGSLTVTPGTINELTASYAITASHALEAVVEITKEVSSSYADSASLAESASFVSFDGNRAVTNQDQPPGIKNVNFGANGITDFIEKVYFANTAPTISSLYYQNTQEFTLSGSLVGAINTADAESQPVTVQTQSSYTLDQFRITGNSIYLNVEASESMNTDSSQAFDAAALPVRATDTLGLFTDKTLYIQILPNTAPVFRENSISGNVITGTQTIPLLESSTNGVKRTIYFTDAQSDTVTINSGSLSADFQTDFQINVNYPSKRIQIEQINNVDYDTYPTYTFELTASDQHYPSQDPESITYLPFTINVTDNLPPVMSDQPLTGVNENENVTNSRPQISGFYRNAGQISATGPEAGDTLTFTSATLNSLSVGGVNVPLGTYFADGDAGSPSQSDPSENAFEMNSTGLMSRKASAVLNSDLIDSYVYTVTVQDNYDPGTTSALITIPIADDVAPAITAPGNLYINESAEINGFVTNNPNGVGTQFQFQSTYSVQNETVSWQLNPTTPFAIDGNQRMSANANISGSYFSTDPPIAFSITASNTFGTVNKQAYSVTVTDNQAPTILARTPISVNAPQNAGTNMCNITISDVENNIPYVLTLTGTDSTLLNPVSQNGNGTSWQIQLANSEAAGKSFSYNEVVTDSYGSTRTYARTLTLGAAPVNEQIFVYDVGLGTTNINNDLGIASNNTGTTPQTSTASTGFGFLEQLKANLGSNFTYQYGGTRNGNVLAQTSGANVKTMMRALGSSGTISRNNANRIAILIPSGSDLTNVPTVMTDAYNASAASNISVLEIGADGVTIDGINTIEPSNIYQFSVSPSVNGFSQWYMVVNQNNLSSATSINMGLNPANGSGGV